MKAYSPKRQARKPIRLKYYDYRSQGYYFITICCKDKQCFFGEVVGREMKLNRVGEVVQQCWENIPIHFPNVILHPFIIMPNHLHGIIEIVGANQYSPEYNDMVQNKGEKDVSPLRGTSQTVGSIVRGFKIGVTKWGRNNTDINEIWQRNYYEHIIRDEKSYFQIIEYIENNPLKWEYDSLYS